MRSPMEIDVNLQASHELRFGIQVLVLLASAFNLFNTQRVLRRLDRDHVRDTESRLRARDALSGARGSPVRRAARVLITVSFRVEERRSHAGQTEAQTATVTEAQTATATEPQDNQTPERYSRARAVHQARATEAVKEEAD